MVMFSLAFVEIFGGFGFSFGIQMGSGGFLINVVLDEVQSNGHFGGFISVVALAFVP